MNSTSEASKPEKDEGKPEKTAQTQRPKRKSELEESLLSAIDEHGEEVQINTAPDTEEIVGTVEAEASTESDTGADEKAE